MWKAKKGAEKRDPPSGKFKLGQLIAVFSLAAIVYGVLAAMGEAAVTLAFIGTNLMEIVSPHGRGLGALFDSGKTNSDYPLMFAVLIALAFLGIVLYYVVVALEKIFAGWAERQPD